MQILLKAVRWTSLISVPAFLLAIPYSPARAETIGSCADSLISSGVAESSAASACSDAYKPNDLASCVEDIITTDVGGNEALQACYRVRRPDELANCVTTISGAFEQGQSALALNTCQRSLLPERHAECTLDIAGISDISSEEAMTSCLAAEIMPGQVSPESAPEGVTPDETSQ